MDEQRIRNLLDCAEADLREARAVLNNDKERAGGRLSTIQSRLRSAHSALSRALDEVGG